MSNAAIRDWRGQNGKVVVPVTCFQWRLDRDVTIGLALVAGTQRLASAGLDTPRLDSEVLLAHVLGWTRAQLYAYPERSLADVERLRYEQFIERRFAHEPVAYLVGRKAFYGLELTVDRRVLIPRPETELVVDLALDLILQADRQRDLALSGNGHRAQAALVDPVTIADIGTGSGAIALAIAANTKEAVLYASDISEAALALAQENAARHGLVHRVTFLHGDLLSPLQNPVDLIVANLPYVASHEWEVLAPDIAVFEPALALSGGTDGLQHIRNLLCQAPHYLRSRGAVLLEIGAGQGAEVAQLARRVFPGAMVEVLSDYAYRDRIVRVQT